MRRLLESGGVARHRRVVLGTAIVGLLFALASPELASAQLLDGIVRAYRDASDTWLARLLPIAQGTFALLAAIELVVSAISWGFRRDGLDAFVAQGIKKFLVLSFLFTLISAFPLFVPYVVRGFEWTGQQASGTTAVNPSEVLAIGSELASLLTEAADSVGPTSLPNFLSVVIIGFTAVFISLCFAMIAAQMVLVLVETAIVLTGGIVFLGFAGFRGTSGLADGYLRWSFHVGIKIFFLYLMVGVGAALARDWALILPAAITARGYQAIFEIVGASLIFALLVWRIPSAVASQISSGLTFRLQDALGDHG